MLFRKKDSDFLKAHLDKFSGAVLNKSRRFQYIVIIWGTKRYMSEKK